MHETRLSQTPPLPLPAPNLAVTQLTHHVADHMKAKSKSKTVYFAGELFDIKHLVGNAWLAEAVYEQSHGRYLCRLPQDLEHKNLHPQTIRDQDLRSLLACDAALFNFDGAELDSGTVVEFIFAKFADIPAVVLRSDARAGGDSGKGNPWNLMLSYYPRTFTVFTSSLLHYRTLRKNRRGKRPIDEIMHLAGQHASTAAGIICDRAAAAVVKALDRVTSQEPVMPKHLREEIYQWLALMPAFKGKPKALRKELEKILEHKVERDLL